MSVEIAALLARRAKERWKNLAADQEILPLVRLFSLKHEFPTEWHRLRTVADQTGITHRP
jgi:hypothetical protein